LVGTTYDYFMSASDDGGVDSCNFLADGVVQGSIPLTCWSPTYCTGFFSYAFTTLGGHTVRFSCKDTSGNVGVFDHPIKAVASIAVSGPQIDSATPNVAYVGQTNTFTAAYSDETGVASCDWKLDFSLPPFAVPMDLSNPGGTSGVASVTLPADYDWYG